MSTSVSAAPTTAACATVQPSAQAAPTDTISTLTAKPALCAPATARRAPV